MAWLQMHLVIYDQVLPSLATSAQPKSKPKCLCKILPTLDVAVAAFVPFDRNNFDVVTSTFHHEPS